MWILASFEGPTEAQMEPKSVPRLSGETMLRAMWSLEGFWAALEAHTTRFGPLLESPRRPKWLKNRFWLLLGMRNVKMLIFYTPPMQNHYFWGPKKAKMNGKSGLEAIFSVFEAILKQQCTIHRIPRRQGGGGAAPP